MLVKENLPGAKILTEVIKYKRLKANEYDLYLDGSISKTVKLKNDDLIKIIDIIENAAYGTAIQIHIGGKERDKYVTVQKEVGKVKKIGYQNLFKTDQRIIKDSIIKNRYNALNYLNNILPGDHIVDKTDILKLLTQTLDPKFNLSFIKTSENCASTILSINNPSRIVPNKMLNGEYSENVTTVITLIKGSEDYSNFQKFRILENVNLLAGVKTGIRGDTERRVHTINDSEKIEVITESHNAWQINVSFIITSDNMDKLIEDTNNFINNAKDNHLILYWHTNDTYKHFISMYPGYSRYCNHLNDALKEYVKRFTMNYIRY